MDNKFFQFVEAYKDDITAFINALKAFVESLIAKLGGSEEEAE